MLDFDDFLQSNAAFRKFEVDTLLFTAYDCPLEGSPVDYWVDRNYFCYVIRGGARWKTPRGDYILQVGDAAFLKNGAHRVFKILNGDFCALLIFTPDDFIRSVMKDDIRMIDPPNKDTKEDSVIPLQLNKRLHDYFNGVLHYFSEPQPPAKSLLQLKFKELILHLLTGGNNPLLTNYFIELAKGGKKALKPIMEEHFIFHLKLTDFAKLSDRSLATFKRDFQKTFQMPPGKWLRNKRLEYSKYLLETTEFNIGEIAFKSGFENTSHFIKVFKEKYNRPPLQLKKALQIQ
ncbi:MAG: AraC family transcriptional regulator [Aureisphaera sp.]